MGAEHRGRLRYLRRLRDPLQPDQKSTQQIMSKEQTLGIVRHALTFGGGLLIARGYGDPQLVTELVGGIVSIVGAFWSIKSKRKAK